MNQGQFLEATSVEQKAWRCSLIRHATVAKHALLKALHHACPRRVKRSGEPLGCLTRGFLFCVDTLRCMPRHMMM